MAGERGVAPPASRVCTEAKSQPVSGTPRLVLGAVRVWGRRALGVGVRRERCSGGPPGGGKRVGSVVSLPRHPGHWCHSGAGDAALEVTLGPVWEPRPWSPFPGGVAQGQSRVPTLFSSPDTHVQLGVGSPQSGRPQT